MSRVKILTAISLVIFLTSCGQKTEPQSFADLGEAGSSKAVTIPIDLPNFSDDRLALTVQGLDYSQSMELIDIRGVGDSGWSRTHQQRPLNPEFGRALDQFDVSGTSYRGDLSFVNWESVVGESCNQFANQYTPGQSYAFVSHPANIVQAFEKGFRLFGLSNNHSRDCVSASGFASGTDMSTQWMDQLAQKYQDLMWHGLSRQPGNKRFPMIKSYRIKNRQLTVAFASLYTGRKNCPDSVCLDDAPSVLAEFKRSRADLKILAIHSGFTGEKEVVDIGMRFIQDSDGDIVFGHGPHVWKAVRVVAKPNQKKGVIFESLGNFIHPNLAARKENYIGRALFDKNTMSLRQVQIIPVHNQGMSAQFSSANGAQVPTNLTWKQTEWLLGNQLVRGVYSNIR